MERTVNLSLQGNKIIVDPSSLNVQVGDTVKFHSTDNKFYDIVIANKDNFFTVSVSGTTIELDVPVDDATDVVKSKPIGSVKYYNVTTPDNATTPGGGTPYAPPRIIIIS
jgi:plastocyanin